MRKKAMKPEECDLLIAEFFMANDLEGVLSLQEENCGFVMSNGETTYTKEGRIEAVKGFLGAKEMRWTSGPHAFYNASKDIALLISEYETKIQNELGEWEQVGGKNIEVVRKQTDGSWKFMIDHPFGGDLIEMLKNQ